MTKAEHTLMITLFTRQVEMFQMIIEVLKSNDLIQGDLRGYHELGRSTQLKKSANEVRRIYLDLAKQLGVETGLRR